MNADVTKVMLLNADIETIRTFCRADKGTHELLTDDHFWQQLVYKHFNSTKKLGSTWRTTFEILSTPVYHVFHRYEGRFSEDFTTTETFFTRQSAVEYCIGKIWQYKDELDPEFTLDNSHHKFSAKFLEILNTTTFCDLEFEIDKFCAQDHDKDLWAEYGIYDKMYRDELGKRLTAGATVGSETEYCHIKLKRINP